MGRVAVIVLLCVTALLADQFVWLDEELEWDGSGWYRSDNGQTGGFSSPSNWVSPVNYRDGTLYKRMEITYKESTLPVVTQMCIWGDGRETCSPCTPKTGVPTLIYKSDSPATWWTKDGALDYTKAGTYRCAVVLKENSCGGLWVDNGSGSWCMPGSVEEHIPIRMKFTAIVVSQGATLDPPANWADCPDGWGCSGQAVRTTMPARTAPPRLLPSGPATLYRLDGTRLNADAAMGSPTGVVLRRTLNTVTVAVEGLSSHDRNHK